MSEYLWDKTGEADADVQHLESLLGELRHKPRTLELPLEGEAAHSEFNAHTLPARRRSRAGWLAVAAALLLAFVAFAFVLLRASATDGEKQSAAQSRNEDSYGSGPQNNASQSVATPRRESATVGLEQVKRDEQVAAQSLRQPAQEHRKERQLAVVETRRQATLPRVVTAVEANDGGAQKMSQATTFDSVSLKMRLAAKEQLLYALRLTSSKMREVREKAQGVNDPKQSLDGRNRIN
jgi:hypothetical protein